MRSNDAVVLSAANLDTIEKNLGSLATNVGMVNSSIEHVNTKVNSVTESVKTVEEEIKKFMLEIRESTIVSNAKQSIIMDQDELNKKYGHYDSVRRKVNGIFQATDINSVKKATIENVSQEVIVDTPNYWLAPALVAICAWFNNNQILAYSALKEALNRNDEKTSLLFCLIHLRANRYKRKKKWLHRYLEMQDPTKMELKIIAVMDAITSGTFDISLKKLFLQKVMDWMQELDRQSAFADAQVNRWQKFFASQIKISKTIDFYYISKYVSNYEQIFARIDIMKLIK